jgi:hypothetical protein
MCIDLLCSMADSQQAVKYMSGDELGLLRDLLVFLHHAMEGPNPENQLKVAYSDVPMALNLIVAADSPIEARLNRRDATNGRVTLEALCFRVLTTCLEGRKDQLCHLPLREHTEMTFLYEKVSKLMRPLSLSLLGTGLLINIYVLIDIDIFLLYSDPLFTWGHVIVVCFVCARALVVSSKARTLDSKCRVVLARSNPFSGSWQFASEVEVAAEMEALANLWTIHHELFPEVCALFCLCAGVSPEEDFSLGIHDMRLFIFTADARELVSVSSYRQE